MSITTTGELVSLARREALEDAALTCDRHADFLMKEAHAGGDWKHLMTRGDEAAFLAAQIRQMIGEHTTEAKNERL